MVDLGFTKHVHGSPILLQIFLFPPIPCFHYQMNLKNFNVKEFGISIPPFLALVASNLEMHVSL